MNYEAKRYTKKPITIEAVQYLGDEGIRDLGGRGFRGDWIPDWLMVAWDKGDIFATTDGLAISTLEGPLNVSVNDFIIQGVQGEIYPCKPDIFEETYSKEEK